MGPSQVRAELLGEHFELRQKIDDTLALVEKDGAAPDAVRKSLDGLATKLRAHAQHEQEALRVILEKIGERARKRNAVMDEAHVAEHARLVGVVREAGAAADAATRRERVKDVLRELEEHMIEEEGVLLAEDLFDEHQADA
jgi:hypothetical protein